MPNRNYLLGALLGAVVVLPLRVAAKAAVFVAKKLARVGQK